jgi:hypothetical protein
MTFSDGRSRPVTLSSVPDEGSGLVAWTNLSQGSDLEGPLFASGPTLIIVVNAGAHPAWSAGFGPAATQ